MTPVPAEWSSSMIGNLLKLWFLKFLFDKLRGPKR
jgi:hypothetical protein